MNIRLTKNAKVGSIDGLKGQEFSVDEPLGNSIIADNRAVEIKAAPKAQTKSKAKTLTAKDTKV